MLTHRYRKNIEHLSGKLYIIALHNLSRSMLISLLNISLIPIIVVISTVACLLLHFLSIKYNSQVIQLNNNQADHCGLHWRAVKGDYMAQRSH